MRVFKIRPFQKWTKKVQIYDSDICKTVSEIEDGLLDACLGGCIYKKRIPLRNRGKRASARSILAYRVNSMIIFLHGYSKNEKVDITKREQFALEELGYYYLNFSETQIERAIMRNELFEVNYDET